GRVRGDVDGSRADRAHERVRSAHAGSITQPGRSGNRTPAKEEDPRAFARGSSCGIGATGSAGLAAAAARGHLDLAAQVLQGGVELAVLELDRLHLAALVRRLDRLDVALELSEVAALLGGELDRLVGDHAPLVLVLAAGAQLVQVLAAGPPERGRRQLD